VFFETKPMIISVIPRFFDDVYVYFTILYRHLPKQ